MASEDFNSNIENDGTDFNLEEFGLLLLSKWHWFLIAVLIALGAAAFKILTTTPFYTRTTSLLIKDEQNNGNSLSREFADLGISGGRSNLANEIQTLKASVLMEEVVKRLGLSVQMSAPQRFRERPLYNDAPVALLLGNDIKENAYFTFKIKPQKNDKVQAYDFETKDTKSDKALGIPFNTWVKTPVGTLRLEMTDQYADTWYGQEITVTKYPVQATGKMYAGRLGVTQNDEESTILQLTLTDEAPARADDILYTLIDVYNDYWIKDKNRVAESTAEFINERLNTLTKELGDVDRDIADYKSQNMLPDVKASANLQLAQSTRNNEQLLALNNQLAMAKYLEGYLSTNSSIGQLLPANTLSGQSSIESQIAAYNEMTLRRNDLLSNSSESNSFVQNYDKQLSVQRSAILRSLNNLIAQIQSQMGNVQRSEGEVNQKIKASPKQARQLLSNERQQKVKESLYIYLLQKREESELSKAYTAYNTRIIQPPTGSSSPTSPQKGRILLIALALGLILPAALLYLREYMNKSVRGRKDLEGMSAPLIGEIPRLDTKAHWWQRRRTQPREIVIQPGNRNIVNEAFRLVRTKLDFYLGEGTNKKVIMMTSFNPGSGKTFITANLAKAVALKGKKILLIDADVRRCSLSMMLDKRPKHGLTSFLGDKDTELESLIVHNVFGDGVDMLPAGIIPPNPTELLYSERLKELFSTVREHYDLVFIDCPPIEIVADATIIKDYADVTIFIVRAGVMDRRALKEVDKLFEEKEYNNMLLLLNGAEFVSGRYGKYRYGYSYGYGAGYGYGRKGDEAYGYHGTKKNDR